MDISKKIFIGVIIGLIVLRAALMIFVMDNVPFTDMRDGGFRPTFTESYQPDEPEFYQIASGLVSGKFEKRVPNIGAPLIFAPFVYFTGAGLPDELAPVIFIFEAFILFSLALVLVALMAKKLFNSYKWAALGAALFAFYPWFLLGFFKLIGYKNAVPAFHYQLWIFILSDYLSAFWVYLSFFLIFKWFKDIFENSDISMKPVLFLAIASGAALLTRVGNFWLILIIFAVFLYFKQIKRIAIYGFFLFIAYLPQLIFNTVTFGAPWIYGYRDSAVNASTLSTPLTEWFNPSNLWLNFSKFSPNHYFILFLIATGSIIVIFVLGYKYLARINKNFAIIASAWFWSYLIFYWFFNESLSQLRYFLPIVPIFICFIIAAVLYLNGLCITVNWFRWFLPPIEKRIR